MESYTINAYLLLTLLLGQMGYSDALPLNQGTSDEQINPTTFSDQLPVHTRTIRITDGSTWPKLKLDTNGVSSSPPMEEANQLVSGFWRNYGKTASEIAAELEVNSALEHNPNIGEASVSGVDAENTADEVGDAINRSGPDLVEKETGITNEISSRSQEKSRLTTAPPPQYPYYPKPYPVAPVVNPNYSPTGPSSSPMQITNPYYGQQTQLQFQPNPYPALPPVMDQLSPSPPLPPAPAYFLQNGFNPYATTMPQYYPPQPKATFMPNFPPPTYQQNIYPDQNGYSYSMVPAPQYFNYPPTPYVVP